MFPLSSAIQMCFQCLNEERHLCLINLAQTGPQVSGYDRVCRSVVMTAFVSALVTLYFVDVISVIEDR